jgi:hypothetical protein
MLNFVYIHVPLTYMASMRDVNFPANRQLIYFARLEAPHT